jgi:predicted ATP-dependent endonuclease of OLD family
VDFGLTSVRVCNYRTAREIELRTSEMNAFIGQAGTGKSNLLAAVRTLLDPTVELAHDDFASPQTDVLIEGTLASGDSISLGDRSSAPPVWTFPARLRDGVLVVAEPTPPAFATALAADPAPRVALVHALEECVDRVSGVVFLIEEPELFLTPQGHRYLYRLLRQVAASRNQIFISTHAPGFLNVARLDEIHRVSRDSAGVTTVERLEPVDVDDEFRAMCEFDAERGELLMSRAAVLVEGMTEKLAFPYLFGALGHDVDRLAISIVECGGKANLPLFVEICRRAGVPCVAVFDTDIVPGKQANAGTAKLNRLIVEAAGADRVVALEPDFEGALGILARGHKPERAFRALSELEPAEVPPPLERLVELTLSIARPEPPTYS